MDPIDLKLVQQLDKDCRASYATIGHTLEITPRTVQRRVIAMLRSGFIRTFEIMLDPSSLDLGEAVCDIQVKTGARAEDVRNRLFKIPNVHEIIGLAGGTFVAYVYYRDSRDLEYILGLLNATSGVANVDYELNPRSVEQPNKLSRQSWEILNRLNHNARREFAGIALDSGLSARTVQRNIRWLRQTGLVRFGVDVNVSKAENLFIYVLVIRLHHGATKQTIAQSLRDSVDTIWRELRTVNPYSTIFLLYARSTSELERSVETTRLANGVAGVRVLIIVSDTRSSRFLDSRIAEKASKPSR